MTGTRRKMPRPKNGYTKGNVVLCCSGINKLKGNATLEDLRVFISALQKACVGELDANKI